MLQMFLSVDLHCNLKLLCERKNIQESAFSLAQKKKKKLQYDFSEHVQRVRVSANSQKQKKNKRSYSISSIHSGSQPTVQIDQYHSAQELSEGWSWQNFNGQIYELYYNWINLSSALKVNIIQ